MSQQVFKVTTFCMDTWIHASSCIVHHPVLKFSPCLIHCHNSSISRIGTWYTCSCIMP